MMTELNRDFDVCVTRPKAEGEDRTFYINVGLGSVGKDYMEIRLKHPVAAQSFTLFPKSTAAKSFLASVDTGKKPKLNVSVQCHPDTSCKNNMQLVGVGFDNKKVVNIVIDYPVVTDTYFCVLRAENNHS